MAFKLNQHPAQTFEGHVQSGKHTNVIRKRQEVKQMLVKGRDGERKQIVSTKERNHTVTKKLLKISYFVAKKVGFTKKIYQN